MVKRILVLHGNRQTSQLLLGRLDRIRKRLSKEFKFDFIAPDAPFPHPDDDNLRTWWNRVDNAYEGLDKSLDVLKELHHEDIVGILGFSQGARFAHLVSLLHMNDPDAWFPKLSFVILVAGYDAPLPDNFSLQSTQEISIPSLHVWGRSDKLITPDQSRTLSEQYFHPNTLIHDGNHYVPTKAPQIQGYVDFIRQVLGSVNKTKHEGVSKSSETPPAGKKLPDEETTAMQEEELQALEAIFFEEVEVKSSCFPMSYLMKLLPTEEEEGSNWPPRPLTLEISYPFDYPLESTPDFRLIHDNNVFEFPSKQMETTMKILKDTAREEIGMPSVLSCIFAVKEYLDSPASDTTDVQTTPKPSDDDEGEIPDPTKDNGVRPVSSGPRSASPEDVEKGIAEGLVIAERILMGTETTEQSNISSNASTEKGGAFWTYTIGLVGKPSAGKSTFFNAASAFSRQRGVSEGTSEWGGASVAAHPFTTIDPNIGYCLVPAPLGSCPEDDLELSKHEYGSTHGRDPNGQRLLPILLKDVAGLVPGAYQGRGKGNRFLNDLCDATVLVHVVDASGTADAQGNTTGGVDLTNPMDDMQWIRSELVQWVYGNVADKWDTISRKGRRKLSGMFSGYGQSLALTERIFLALEKFMEVRYDKDRVFESIEQWDEADVHRLVSAFLGVRFPMALALNKCDLPTSGKHVREIQESLPIHGAHVGTPLTARSEMNFVHEHLTGKDNNKVSKPPSGVWQCLTSAVKLREPVLVFPVSDMNTYAPLQGLNERAVGHPSLPSVGMIRCINGSGGIPPTCWNDTQQSYLLQSSKERTAKIQLRDVIPMKPGSTVADVFLALKNVGALGGEFVRAEAAGNIGEKSKPIPKITILGKHNRILKIMTNKRTMWQS